MASTFGQIESAIATSISGLSSPSVTGKTGPIQSNHTGNTAFVVCTGGDSDFYDMNSLDTIDAEINIVIMGNNRDDVISIIEQLAVLWLKPSGAAFTAINALGVQEITGKQEFYPIPVGGSRHMGSLVLTVMLQRSYI